MGAISDAPDRGEARKLVARLLGVRVGAESILGIELHLATKGEVAEGQAEYESLEKALDRGR